MLKGLPGEVERARDDVMSCLRVIDQRPLDCWKRVEVLKREVRRMEEKFVGRCCERLIGGVVMLLTWDGGGTTNIMGEGVDSTMKIAVQICT